MPRAPDTHHIFKPDPAEREQAKVERWQRDDARRGSAASRGYDSRWVRASRGYRLKHPLCVAHEVNGLIVPAEMVDHVIPHKGDMTLFWDSDNWQSLCWWCHRVIKAILEQRYKLGEIDAKDLRLDRELPEFFISVL